MGLVDFPGRARRATSPHCSRERVYRDGKLLYAVGAPIPLAEAVRQGIVRADGSTAKAVRQDAAQEDKAVRQDATEDKGAGAADPATKPKTRRRRTPARPKPEGGPA